MESLEVAELISELGNSLRGPGPFPRFYCVPGGFELVTMASAISNMHCKIGAREDDYIKSSGVTFKKKI